MFDSSKDIIKKTEFYEKIESLDETEIDQYKIKVLDKKCGGKLFKFIQFDQNMELNRIKLDTLYNNKLWFGCPWTMNDSTEFKMPSNSHFMTSKEAGYFRYHCELLYEMYVLCSFSIDITEKMWNEYANKGNGICLVFDVEDYDWFFPVEYVKNKNRYSFVPSWRRMLKRYTENEAGILPNLSSLSIAPFFIKEKINPDTGNDSSLEKEVRAIYCMYSDDELHQGILSPGYCQENKIYGTQVEWESINLVLSNVILGYNLQNDIRLEIEKKFKDKCVYA